VLVCLADADCRVIKVFRAARSVAAREGGAGREAVLNRLDAFLNSPVGFQVPGFLHDFTVRGSGVPFVIPRLGGP